MCIEHLLLAIKIAEKLTSKFAGKISLNFFLLRYVMVQFNQFREVERQRELKIPG